MPNHQPLTVSEKLLNDILCRKGLSPIRIPPSGVDGERRPDFKVEIGHTTTIWEVKEICANPNERSIEEAVSEGCVYSIKSKPRLNSDIDSAIKQFISYGCTNNPCIIAIMDNRSFFTKDLILPSLIMSILAGRGHYSTNENGESYEIHRDKSRISNHTFLSAIALIHKETEEITLFHNPKSAFPLVFPYLTTVFKYHYHLEKKEHGHIWTQTAV